MSLRLQRTSRPLLRQHSPGPQHSDARRILTACSQAQCGLIILGNSESLDAFNSGARRQWQSTALFKLIKECKLNRAHFEAGPSWTIRGFDEFIERRLIYVRPKNVMDNPIAVSLDTAREITVISDIQFDDDGNPIPETAETEVLQETLPYRKGMDRQQDNENDPVTEDSTHNDAVWVADTVSGDWNVGERVVPVVAVYELA